MPSSPKAMKQAAADGKATPQWTKEWSQVNTGGGIQSVWTKKGSPLWCALHNKVYKHNGLDASNAWKLQYDVAKGSTGTGASNDKLEMLQKEVQELRKLVVKLGKSQNNDKMKKDKAKKKPTR